MGFQMNKKGLQFQKAFYSIIAFSVIIIAVGVLFNDYSTGYGYENPSDLGNLNRLDNISQDVNVQKGQVSANDPDPGSNAEANTFRGVYGIIANIFSPFEIVFGDNGMISSLSQRFGIPDYVGNMIVALMIVAFTFSLIAIIFRLGRNA